MFSTVRSRLTFSNVVAVMAMFIALGGFSYAAVKIGSKQIANNSIKSKDIRDERVKGRDIRSNAVGPDEIADNSVDTNHIADNAVSTGKLADDAVDTTKIADGTITNADLNAEAAVAKGFATIDSTNVNGPATVHNFGGQQTNVIDGVTAERVGQGIYDVSFVANPDTGFSGVDSVNDLTVQVTGRNGFSTGSIFDAASSASTDLIEIRVFMRRPDNGNTIDSDFSVQFYAHTP